MSYDTQDWKFIFSPQNEVVLRYHNNEAVHSRQHLVTIYEKMLTHFSIRKFAKRIFVIVIKCADNLEVYAICRIAWFEKPTKVMASCDKLWVGARSL